MSDDELERLNKRLKASQLLIFVLVIIELFLIVCNDA